MSGRDLRSFVTAHRLQSLNFTTNEEISPVAEALLARYVSGAVAGRQYKEVDYGRLLAEARGRREEGERGRRRVECLRGRGRETRERALVRRHREVWEKERTRLREAWKATVTDLGVWRSNILLHGPDGLKSFLTETTDYETALWEERERFESETVDPLWSLRIDLKNWTEGEGEGLTGEERRSILEQLEAVREEQARIQEVLRRESELLSAAVEECAARYVDTNEPEIARGIPEEVAALEWPDHALRDSMLKEFSLLDDRYQAMLHQLEEEHSDINSTHNGGWSDEDALRFSAILSQYPPSMADRRALYVDRLQRELPHKSRREIVTHESWFTAVRHYHTRRKAYLRSWAEQGAELVQQVEGVCRESARVRAVREGEKEERERQRQLCQELAEKVSRWRRTKLEAVRIEAEVAAKVREREEEERREEEVRERALREKQKAKVNLYQAEMEQKRVVEREKERQIMAEARIRQSELAKIDRERVQYRAVLQSQRQEERREGEERAEGERKRREWRLERLRQQVRVDAPVDPLRVLRETQASLARGLAHQDAELGLQHPLFPLHGFSDQTVTSDTRFKVALALRNVGLHETEYARRVLASIPPPLPPRPDQKSSIFK